MIVNVYLCRDCFEKHSVDIPKANWSCFVVVAQGAFAVLAFSLLCSCVPENFILSCKFSNAVPMVI